MTHSSLHLLLVSFLLFCIHETHQSCFLEKITYHDSYDTVCSDYWFRNFVLLCVTLGLLFVHFCLLLNLYRTPWSTNMSFSLGRNEDVEESPLRVCERCGTASDLTEQKNQEGSLTIFCSGCICYKFFLKTFYPQLFIVPLILFIWIMGIGKAIYLMEIACSFCIGLTILPHFMQLAFNKAAYKFMFSRRLSSKRKEGDSEWQKLDKMLDNRSLELLNKITNKYHKQAVIDRLQEEEEVVWVDHVTPKLMLRNNYDLPILAFFFFFLVMIWGSVALAFVVSSDRYTVGFGLMISSIVILVSVPMAASYIFKVNVTYILTNKRAMRVTMTYFFFENRVYSYPLDRMTLLNILYFPTNPEGSVCWRLSGDEETFNEFEFLHNVETVESVILRYKSKPSRVSEKPDGTHVLNLEELESNQNESIITDIEQGENPEQQAKPSKLKADSFESISIAATTGISMESTSTFDINENSQMTKPKASRPVVISNQKKEGGPTTTTTTTTTTSSSSSASTSSSERGIKGELSGDEKEYYNKLREAARTYLICMLFPVLLFVMMVLYVHFDNLDRIWIFRLGVLCLGWEIVLLLIYAKIKFLMRCRRKTIYF